MERGGETGEDVEKGVFRKEKMNSKRREGLGKCGEWVRRKGSGEWRSGVGCV